MDEANSIPTMDEANSVPTMMEVNQGVEEGFASNLVPPMTESAPAVVTSQALPGASDQLQPLPSQKKRKPTRQPSEVWNDFEPYETGSHLSRLRMPSHEPSTRSTDLASPAELLSELSIFSFSLLSPKDQQDKIEQISNKLAAEDVNVGSLAAAAGETKEDVRRKAFATLFNKAPVVTRVDLFKEFKKKFFFERRSCEVIPCFRKLGSKQSRYAEFYLGLSIIWFKARCASDPRNLIQVVVSKAGVDDHIFEKLVNETEEDFKLRRFTESFKQLQFSSQEDIVEFIQDAVFRDLVDDVSNTFEMREDVFDTFEMCDLVFHQGCTKIVEDSDSEPLQDEFFKMSPPDLRGPKGATTTQGGGQGATATQGGGQGAITQGGQGTSEQ